jgi:hypothetical protein
MKIKGNNCFKSKQTQTKKLTSSIESCRDRIEKSVLRCEEAFPRRHLDFSSSAFVTQDENKFRFIAFISIFATILQCLSQQQVFINKNLKDFFKIFIKIFYIFFALLYCFSFKIVTI